MAGVIARLEAEIAALDQASVQAARKGPVLLQLLESNPEAQRDLLEFRHTLEASCAYYAALRATDVDRERLTAAIGSFFSDLDLDVFHAAPRSRLRIAIARWMKTVAQAATVVFLFLIPLVVAFAREYFAQARRDENGLDAALRQAVGGGHGRQRRALDQRA